MTTPLLALALALAPLVPSAARPSHDSRPQDDAPAPWLRIVEEDGLLRLELGVRTYRRTGEIERGTEERGAVGEEDGPTVTLVAAMHVADAGYYRALQAFLDARDVVLYERVEPAAPQAAERARLTPAERARIAATERRMARLAALAERWRTEHGAYPARLDALRAPADGAAAEGRLAVWRVDAWERALAYERAEDGASFRLRSLGADGAPGGEGAAADLVLAELPPLALAELEGAGMQADMADALGLVFQLDGIDYTGAHWRNSDLSMDALKAELENAGIEANELFGALDGSSLMSKLAGGILKLVGASRSGSGMLKIMGIEVLARADEVIGALPPEMARMFEVLLQRRNEVVARDLAALLADEPDVGTVAVFYGAAHMPDLERRLTEELGLEQVREQWIAGVQVDLAATGIPPGQIDWLRKTIRRSLEQALRGMRK